MTAQQYTGEAVSLLSHLIATPSVSRDERRAADIMEEELTRCGFTPHREANNVWAIGPASVRTVPRCSSTPTLIP